MNIYDKLEKASGDKSKCPEYLRKIISLAREELKKRSYCTVCTADRDDCICGVRNLVVTVENVEKLLGEKP